MNVSLLQYNALFRQSLDRTWGGGGGGGGGGV